MITWELYNKSGWSSDDEDLFKLLGEHLDILELVKVRSSDIEDYKGSNSWYIYLDYVENLGLLYR